VRETVTLLKIFHLSYNLIRVPIMAARQSWSCASLAGFEMPEILVTWCIVGREISVIRRLKRWSYLFKTDRLGR
jgi:hypothetical protein